MGDLDLEELDKAVNSLMNQRDESANGLGDQPSSASDRYANSGIDQAIDQPSSTSQTPPSIRRSTGRFMDVMPPSSGYKPKRSVGQVPSESASREGIDLTPSHDLTATIDPQPDNPEPVNTPVDTSEPPVENASEEPNVDLLDPVESLIDEALQEATGAETPTPMQTPFLTNIEVDKRPLGQPVKNDLVENPQTEQPENSPETSEVNQNPSADNMPDPIADWHEEDAEIASNTEDKGDLSSPSSTVEDAWTTERPVDDISNATVVRSEFEPAVMALESIPDPEDNPEPITPDEVATEAVAPTEEVIEPEAPTETKQADNQTVTKLSNPGDIPRQYTQEPANEPEPAGVFDEVSSEGPQPLKHPAKKKSGWLIVVWILLLLLLGVGGGVVAWFFLLK